MVENLVSAGCIRGQGNRCDSWVGLFSSLRCTSSCLATLHWHSQWEWVTGCFRVDADPPERAQNILGLGNISISSYSLIEGNFTNKRPFPTIPSHQQNQHQRGNPYKSYLSSFMVVSACRAHLFVFLT